MRIYPIDPLVLACLALAALGFAYWAIKLHGWAPWRWPWREWLTFWR